MGVLGIKLKPEAIRQLSFGSITTSYANLGTPFKNPISVFHIVNDSDVDIYVSFFSQENHLFVKSGSFTLYDVAANKDIPGGSRAFSQQTQIQVKSTGASASSGFVYLMTFYGSSD